MKRTRQQIETCERIYSMRDSVERKETSLKKEISRPRINGGFRKLIASRKTKPTDEAGAE